MGYVFIIWTLLYNILGVIASRWGYEHWQLGLYTGDPQQIPNHRAPGFRVAKAYLVGMIISVLTALGTILQTVLQGGPEAMVWLSVTAYALLIVEGACIVTVGIALRKDWLPTAVIAFFHWLHWERGEFIKDYYDWTVFQAFVKQLLGLIAWPLMVLRNLHEPEKTGQTVFCGMVSSAWLVFYNVIGLFGLIKGTRLASPSGPLTHQFDNSRGRTFYRVYTGLMSISVLLAISTVINGLIVAESTAVKSTGNSEVIMGSVVLGVELTFSALSLCIGALRSQTAIERRQAAGTSLPRPAAPLSPLFPPHNAIDEPPACKAVVLRHEADLPPSCAEATNVPNDFGKFSILNVSVHDFYLY
ncbi:uncharacterized protein LOC129598881 [Paramacrobiotus metropolitanus]|uniref:uncharacterized protein LOC129598881 n=1 Tax=Paramacrobiotus metropolitanus TaxID=2943436 RepID=UPI002445B425|nr:uncharacterized protein LOC129598881 [Paramacrobiotus metropolitanus]